MPDEDIVCPDAFADATKAFAEAFACRLAYNNEDLDVLIGGVLNNGKLRRSRRRLSGRRCTWCGS